jgi:hypothetical protein
MDQYLGLHANCCYACRVRGQDNGGWNGDEGWQGHIKFFGEEINGTMSPTILKTEDIRRMGEREHHTLKILSIDFPEAGDAQKEIAVEGGAPDGARVRYVFQLHRDAIPHLVSYTRNALGERVATSDLIENGNKHWDIFDPNDGVYSVGADGVPAVASGVSSYAAQGESETGKLAEEAKIVDYAPSTDDQKLITIWENLLGSVMDPTVIRTMAVAYIRGALRNPGESVVLGSMAGVDRRSLRRTIESILACSGLWRFAKVGQSTLLFTQPEGSSDSYDWGRLCEQWLAPISDLKIEVHAIPESSVTSIPGDKQTSEALREALAMCKQLDDVCPMAHHPAHPREPHLK